MDDNHYINQVIAGNSALFAVLIDRHKDLVFTLCLNITRSREDAEEVAQDSFLKAFQKLSTFRNDSGFRTWLYRIAYNEAITKVRKKKVVTTSLDDRFIDELPDEEYEESIAGMDEAEQKEVIGRVLEKLPETDRVIVTLYYLESCPVREISEITGLGESNVKVRLHRIRKRIYSELQHIFKIKSLSL
ncbi:MAG TPA: RNA polymerase sigma factor [Bacteroidales bacterium]|nr:RNA polymerase sigma factor [Bacteroidales bacterium]HOX78445.1 RNA polymerase sigma factor [Bacteroidales bacterium]HPI85031.1 RNA polymerase sigma factor [Bacteroidales bacterium]HPM93776.1 RNA polymerase sigma factor [Bacteroidales bacterium]